MRTKFAEKPQQCCEKKIAKVFTHECSGSAVANDGTACNGIACVVLPSETSSRHIPSTFCIEGVSKLFLVWL